MKIRNSKLLLSKEDVAVAIEHWLRRQILGKKDKYGNYIDNEQPMTVTHTRSGVMVLLGEENGNQDKDQAATSPPGKSSPSPRKRGRPRAQPSSTEGAESASAALVAA